MSEIILVNLKIKLSALKSLASERFGNLVKAVVDIRQKIMSVGGEMHADGEMFLIEYGSSQDDLWGINIYPESPCEGFKAKTKQQNKRSRRS